MKNRKPTQKKITALETALWQQRPAPPGNAEAPLGMWNFSRLRKA